MKPKRPLLAIDTTGLRLQALVSDGGVVLAEHSEEVGRGHAERLAPVVSQTLSAAGVAPGELAALAVVTGPGSYAGLRVGLSFAKGFALVRGLPVFGISTLQLWAAEAAARYADAALVIAAHDARRGEVIWQPFAAGEAIAGHQRRKDASAALEVRRLAENHDELSAIAGSGAMALREALIGAGMSESIRAMALDRVNLRLAPEMLAGADPDRYPPAPIYARPPDADPPKDQLAGEAAKG